MGFIGLTKGNQRFISPDHRKRSFSTSILWISPELPSFEKPKNLSRFFGCFFTTRYTPTILNKFKTSTKSFKNDLTCSKAKFFFSIHSGPNFRRHLHCWNHMQRKCSPGNKTQQWHSFGDIQLKQPILIRGCLGYQDKFRNILIFENNGSTIHELAFSTPQKKHPLHQGWWSHHSKKIKKATIPTKTQPRSA